MKAHEHVILEIARERERQIEGEGWTPEHDDEHVDGELAMAAATYAIHAAKGGAHQPGSRPLIWPWDVAWWKPKDPRRDLIRAAALIVAEIERLDRSKADAR
ncbi:hypothetical protein [Limobrevibacterium gyesilva]|uniref:Phage protein n=1 Tax=Limobrevibacterium gyesilva TaxID=2991712 RepID=A0AA41YP78_9PROT|nr:hypothetical protein [Limobrevibacterium gyesilva]MCW3477531.1 hypothetical protein [Limobrevibacterium gyesilva]